jgi:hypothetical protein
VHAAQDVESEPQALFPTQVPAALHVPAVLQTVRLSSQGPFKFFGVAPQVPFVQVPVAQSGLAGVQALGVPAQTPAWQRSLSVHALLSEQAAVLLSECVQPAFAPVGVHVSLVHGLLSLQVTAGLIGVLTHAAVPGAQVSVVQALLSEQFLPGFAESSWHTPSKHLLFVQASPSSQTVPSARVP